MPDTISMTTFVIVTDEYYVGTVSKYEGTKVLTVQPYVPGKNRRHRAESFAVGRNTIYYSIGCCRIMSYNGRVSTEYATIGQFHMLIEIAGCAFGLRRVADGFNILSGSRHTYIKDIAMGTLYDSVNTGQRRYSLSDADGIINADLDLHKLDINCEKTRSGAWIPNGAWTSGSVYTTDVTDGFIYIAARDPREYHPRMLCNVDNDQCVVIGSMGDDLFMGTSGEACGIYDPRADAIWHLEHQTYAHQIAYIV